MPTVVQFRRGTTGQNNAFTGAVGELSVDTSLSTLRVHDGATAGGVEIVNVSSVQTIQNKVFSSHLLPAADSAYDLGDSATKWRDLYLSGNTIYLGNANIHSTGTAVRLPVGSVIGTSGAILDSASALAILSGGTGITYNSSTGEITTTDGDIVHDNLSGFVADEHIAHSGVSVTAGSGLTGGGTIAATRTINIGQGTGITVSADAIATNDAEIVHDNLSGFVADEHIAHSGVTLTAGSGLTGGGTIAASRTFNIGEGTGITVSADAISTNDAEIVHDNLSGFVADEHVAHSSVSVTAGSGLTGGGTIAASRTLNVGAGTGVTVNANDIAIGQDVATTANVTFNSLTTTDGLIVGGNLQVTGTTTTVNSTSLEITDNMIYMNAGESAGSPTQSIDVGWAANINDNGSYTHVGMFRDATDDRFKVYGAYTPEPDAAVEINTGHASFALADFQADTFYGALSGNASTATALQTARTIGGVSFNGTSNINLPGVNTTGNQNTTGSAATLTTARTIGGVSFNGSANINLPGVNTTGNQNTTGSAATLTTARTIGGVSFDGSANINLPGVNTAGNQSTSGNASTATTLQTARTINGVSFNGSANITVEAYIENDDTTNATRYLTFVDNTTASFKRLNEDTNLTYNPSTNTLVAGTFSGALSGNASTATALATGRTISLAGDVTGTSASFNGTGNVSITASLAANTVTSSELSGATSLIIYNSAGTALKTLYGAGS